VPLQYLNDAFRLEPVAHLHKAGRCSSAIDAGGVLRSVGAGELLDDGPELLR
jgi:hypothetical protein